MAKVICHPAEGSALTKINNLCDDINIATTLPNTSLYTNNSVSFDIFYLYNFFHLFPKEDFKNSYRY